MKTYYINNGNENQGPFTLEELKNQQINKTTLIWSEGMKEWKYAVEIEELHSFFIIIPRPIHHSNPLPKIDQKRKSDTILGIKKSYFFLAILFLGILITVMTLTIIQNNKKSELDQKNKQTEFSNEQILLQRKESNEDRIQQEIRKRIESENTSKRRKDSINSRLSEIKFLLIESKNQLEDAKEDLTDTENFKILRSENTKNEQVSSIQKDIDNLRTEIDQLENEANRLNLQLEMIH